MSDIEFINGLVFKLRAENAPDYLLAKFSIKRADLIAWLQSRDDEWINGEAKVSKTSGKPYAAVDNWKPNGAKGGTTPDRRIPSMAPADDSDIPF
jgi:hypothetical protein